LGRGPSRCRQVDKSTLLPTLILGLLVGLWPMPSAAPARPRVDEGALTCEACVLIDDTGRTLFARRPGRRLPNASTTKIVTALVVGERAGDEIVMVSPAAASTGGGGLDLDAGDRITVRDLLVALLLSSSNDAAVALAEHTAGSEEAFVARMNRLASALGAGNTRFVTPHGLDRPGHYSTARDLAVLGRAVLANPRLADIVAMATATVTVSGDVTSVENRNALLEGYPGAVGIKTGFTAGAGNVLVAAARRGGRTLVAVAMRAQDAAADARELLDFGFRTLERTILLDGDAPVAALVFPEGAITVRALAPVRGSQTSASVSVRFAPDVTAPVVPGEAVGKVVVSAARGEVGRVPAVAADAVQDVDMPWPVSVLVRAVRVAAVTVGRA
jgi:serine-type D-Ala-D-Ala carboxypeptidase (penicillin-binding protein 5/6)